jgi:hypothetical protein
LFSIAILADAKWRKTGVQIMSEFNKLDPHEMFRLIYSLPENDMRSMPGRRGADQLARRTAMALRLVVDLVEIGHVTAVACAFYDGDWDMSKPSELIYMLDKQRTSPEFVQMMTDKICDLLMKDFDDDGNAASTLQ